MGKGGGRVAPILKLGPTRTIFLAPALEPAKNSHKSPSNQFGVASQRNDMMI